MNRDTISFDDLGGDFDMLPDIPDTARASQKVIDPLLAGQAKQLYRETCFACNGTGKWFHDRQCFKCKGVGHKDFKEPKEKRDKLTAQRHKREADKRQANLAAFEQEHPDVYRWLEASVANKFELAIKFKANIEKHGTLRPANMKAAITCMARYPIRSSSSLG